MTLSPDALYRVSPSWLQTGLLNLHALRIHSHRHGRRLRVAVEELLRSEWSSQEAIRTYQIERLRYLVSIAYRKAPYYRELFDRLRLKPHDFRDMEDLWKLPLLTKEMVKQAGSSLWTAPQPQPGWWQGFTSGTTGTPLRMWYDRDTCVMTNAVDWRHKIGAGMGAGDWVGMLYGRLVVPVNRSRPPFWRSVFIHRQVWFSGFHLRPDTAEVYEREIRRRRLRFLEGYPSLLSVFAQHILAAGRVLPLQSVISSSETLRPDQRQLIEEAFACRMFDFFASAERVVYAGECAEHTGKHVAEEYGLAEIVDGEGVPVPDGQSGYLVGTSLHNVAMPMLRYRLGDITTIVPGNCPCGRRSRRIAPVTTKEEDMVVTPDGRALAPTSLHHPISRSGFVRQAQLVQESSDFLRVRVVAERVVKREELDDLRAALAERLGQGMHIEVEVVDAIPRDRSGKTRMVVSAVRGSC